METTLRTFSVLVDDEPGVLSQISRLFSRKGFNIESLAVGPTEERGLSRLTQNRQTAGYPRRYGPFPHFLHLLRYVWLAIYL